MGGWRKIGDIYDASPNAYRRRDIEQRRVLNNTPLKIEN
tara:strand:- start:669 stop:785 length:117 start_codon:yes stop_codon:yes gene_type:complete